MTHIRGAENPGSEIEGAHRRQIAVGRLTHWRRWSKCRRHKGLAVSFFYRSV
jgi:hypothetical protein